MNTEILGIIAMFTITLVIGIFLGKYIANVYGYKKTFLDKIFQPAENLIYKISGINPNRQMTWKQNMSAMLTINFVWFILAFFYLAESILASFKSGRKSGYVAGFSLQYRHLFFS